MSKLRYLQCASDLHLEFRTIAKFQDLLRPVAPVLVLAGDIGRPDKPIYHEFLQYCSDNWSKVFLVAGNHEFYNDRAFKYWKYSQPMCVADRIALISQITDGFPNIHFMNRTKIDWEGLTFLGTTLWSDPRGSEMELSTGMNDYRMINPEKISLRPLNCNDVLQWWRRDYAWLDEEISAAVLPTVVITHHVPSFSVIAPVFTGHRLTRGFASSCDDLIRYPVKVWISGHTHQAVRKFIGSTEMIVNPAGYPGEKTGYSPDLGIPR